jgi:torso-like protein
MWKGTQILLLLIIFAVRFHFSFQQKPRLGGAVNVFSRYGYLSISMRVVPRNDSDTWIFREPTLDVFHNPQTAPIKESKATVVFDGDFHMEFCDNVRQLLQVLV